MERLPSREQIEALVRGYHDNPFAILGLHGQISSPSASIRAFFPNADSIEVLDPLNNRITAQLLSHDPSGFFSGHPGPLTNPRDYRFRVQAGGRIRDLDDPYRFGLIVADPQLWQLAKGELSPSYEVFGAHPNCRDGVMGVDFVVWAPNAQRVSLVGDFNDWDGRRHVMRLRHTCGVWEIFLPAVAEGEAYMYEIRAKTGEILPLKADPYGFGSQRPPLTASIVRRLDRHNWKDQEWMEQRAARHATHAPISIYELQLASWKRVPEENNRFLSFAELAAELIPYVKELGFTHIELLPISEYPFDGSWGYQPVGLFAPSSRFGSATDFQAFVDACHRAEIGVLIDWVPGHFPSDPHGLARFDGSQLYEHDDPRKGFHPDWNTCIFNYGRNEVITYLINNARFWLDKYHIDGIRVDAVASMLYLDYSRKAGEWVPNIYGDNKNLEAIHFLRMLNERIRHDFPDTLSVAEESTSWPGVTNLPRNTGLGFHFKWNMGWMHDTLEYMKIPSSQRAQHHEHLTFGLVYAFSEDFILPLSHDEVVHGKGSLLTRMPGDGWQQFANLRAYFGFMWAHPGKKLLFMGGEFAQRREWNHDLALDWHLLEQAPHRQIQNLIGDLNQLYRQNPALHQRDGSSEGFAWIRHDNKPLNLISFLRRGAGDCPTLVVLCNFSTAIHQHFRVGVPEQGPWVELFNTDSARYGGSDQRNHGTIQAEPYRFDGHPWSICLTLPPLATLLFRPSPP